MKEIRKAKLVELVARARQGDTEALALAISRFIPIVRKYARRLGYDDAGPDLTAWVVGAVFRYQPNKTTLKEELKHYLSVHQRKKK